MSLDQTQVLQIANLAKLQLKNEEISPVTSRLNDVFTLLDRLKQISTQDVEPLTNPLEFTQRLRDDISQTHNLRDYYQSLTPYTKQGLYLVPQVI